MLPNDPFPSSEFDDWAETYDYSVSVDQFPFYGYPDVLAKTVALAEARPGLSVLDLGTGTGNLAARFAAIGCELWCTDFSEPMLARAREKLPAARFALHDLRHPLPAEFRRPFDRIVSAYVFHHFEQDEKIRIIRSLSPRLAPGGRMVIADITFQDRAALEWAKTEVGKEWEEEFYWLADGSLSALEKAGLSARYEQISKCAGVFVITAAR
jgi:putative AdoMet-dependent methyltransferase